MIWDLAIIGAGAAGLWAAGTAAAAGRRVVVLEKNTKPGVKILMSGGTRCNVTQATDAKGIVAAFGKNGPFLHSALSKLAPEDVVGVLADEGVPTKREATGKVFPASDRAYDVQQALLRRVKRGGGEIRLTEPLLDWQPVTHGWRLVTPIREVLAHEVILTTGGQSYPGCGTTGDGYRLAGELGLEIVPPRPALVPLRLSDGWARALSGLAVPDARLTLKREKATLAEEGGSFLFTHLGCSGPVVLNLSRALTGEPSLQGLMLSVCWLPRHGMENLLRSLADSPRDTLLQWLAEKLPRRLAEELLRLAGLDGGQRISTLRRDLRQRLVEVIHATPLHPTGTLGFSKAEVTAGGVALHEIDSRTMRCKRYPSLLLAGEVLDLDGPIGGYNFQAAFSTGHLAGLGRK